MSAAARREPAPAGAGAEFVAAAEAALAAGDPARVADADLAAVMTAAVRLYAAKAETADEAPPVVVPERLTPTEIVVAASALIRAAGLNLFDLAMWFRRA